MLEYRIREGIRTEQATPAFILVHGYGSHADDLFSFAPHLPETHTVISIQAQFRSVLVGMRGILLALKQRAN